MKSLISYPPLSEETSTPLPNIDHYIKHMNLQQFNIGDALVLEPAAVPADAIPWVVASGVFYMAAYLVLAAFIFRRREI